MGRDPDIVNNEEGLLITPRNEGSLDRLLRVIVGLILIVLVFVGPQIPWGWVGIVPLLTGIVGFFSAYSLLRIKTCPR